MAPKHPHLIEINAVCFLHRLSRKYGKTLTLDSIPAEEWQALAEQGFHFVWIMGVWKRSPGARQRALDSRPLIEACRAVLNDFKESDLNGSPYAVYEYEPDPALGGKECLAKLRENLKNEGLELILDYVPNHLALDHHWTLDSPGCFVEVSQETASKNPGLFFKTAKQRFLAHGRDPHFEPWNDTVQINYFSPKAREAAVQTLLKIASMAGGARCDMAMLGLSRVFESTWGKFLENTPRPDYEFWSEVIAKVRERFPDFIFLGEVYWDLEWKMQQLGFDFTYDKKLYDFLLRSRPQDIAGHLNAEKYYRDRSARFLENHDEPRAVKLFGFEKSQAAAAVTATVPGMRFFQEGQPQGHPIKVPIQLNRGPEEKDNPEIAAFYQKLFQFAKQSVLHEGTWLRYDALPAGGQHSNHESLLAWSWQLGNVFRLAVINYSEAPAQGRLFFQSESLPGGVVKLKDVLTEAVYERNTEEIKTTGLYIDLGPWKTHLFEFQA